MLDKHTKSHRDRSNSRARNANPHRPCLPASYEPVRPQNSKSPRRTQRTSLTKHFFSHVQSFQQFSAASWQNESVTKRKKTVVSWVLWCIEEPLHLYIPGTNTRICRTRTHNNVDRPLCGKLAFSTAPASLVNHSVTSFCVKGITKHIEEIVWVCFCKLFCELITILNKFCVVCMNVSIQ